MRDECDICGDYSCLGGELRYDDRIEILMCMRCYMNIYNNLHLIGDMTREAKK